MLKGKFVMKRKKANIRNRLRYNTDVGISDRKVNKPWLI